MGYFSRLAAELMEEEMENGWDRYYELAEEEMAYSEQNHDTKDDPLPVEKEKEIIHEEDIPF